MNYALQIQQNGFALVANFIDAGTLEQLSSVLAQANDESAIKQRAGKAFGIRKLLDVVPVVRDFAESEPLQKFLIPILGAKPKTVRGIYFDKTPQANWKVPWHQDVMIAVREKKDLPGFSAWSTKAGVVHVQPPVEVLANILALRIHLDEADESNGALRVILGSHQSGILDDAQIQAYKTNPGELLCRAKRGDALLMRPLLLHASSPGTSPLHRRVLHLEYSALDLPNGLDWYGS